MFEKEWFPHANAIGISWESFWKMNPRIVKLHIQGFRQREEMEINKANMISHLLGLYFQESIASTVGNMFSKKGAKPYKYPEKPFQFNKEDNLSKNEIKEQRKLLVAKLNMMKTNFDLEHKK